jgi:hypothetical protein
MDFNTKVNLKITKSTVMEYFCIQMVENIKDHLPIIRKMVKVFYITLKAENRKVYGITIY